MFPTVTLRVIEGPHEGKELVYSDCATITIGRSSESMFQLHGRCEDLLVSRNHCRIEVHADGFQIRDLESRNGTWVNGMQIGCPSNGACAGSTVFKRRLEDGDQIRIGMSVLEVSFQAQPTPVPESEESALLTGSAGL